MKCLDVPPICTVSSVYNYRGYLPDVQAERRSGESLRRIQKRAERRYLQDNKSVFGHLFVSFLSLYGYPKLQCMLREKRMLNKVSPMDLMDEYVKVYKVEYGDKELMSEVPKKVRELDDKLGLNLFPK